MEYNEYNKYKTPSKTVPSLSEFCLRTVLRFATSITDVGDTPFKLIEPLLLKVSAEQLDLIERNSPHIRPHSESLWKTLVIRDFPDRAIPQYATTPLSSLGSNKTQSYRSLYRKYYKDKEAHLKKVHDRLKLSFDAIKAERSKTKITKLDVDPMALRPSRGNKIQLRDSYATPQSAKTIIDKAKDYVKSRSPMFRLPQQQQQQQRQNQPAYNLGGKIPIAVRQRLGLDRYDELAATGVQGRQGPNYLPVERRSINEMEEATFKMPLSRDEAKRRREEILASRVAEKRARVERMERTPEKRVRIEPTQERVDSRREINLGGQVITPSESMLKKKRKAGELVVNPREPTIKGRGIETTTRGPGPIGKSSATSPIAGSGKVSIFKLKKTSPSVFLPRKRP